MDNNEVLLTPAALLDFLRQVDELADKDISVDETSSALTVTIGESTYGIDLNKAETVEVPDEVVEEVADVADDAYAELGEAGVDVTESDEDTIEGGLISEALKTLAVGGLVRLAFDKMKKREEVKKAIVSDGILFCSGMIAGEGLVGILLALLAVFGVADAIDISGKLGLSEGVSSILALVVFGLVILSLLKFSVWKKRKPEKEAAKE